jgi:hypothetical protein
MDPIEEKLRQERLRTIAVEMDSLVRDLGPKWIRLAHLRKEAHQIITELEKKDE